MATPTELSREELERRAALGMIELDDDDLLAESTYAKPKYQVGEPDIPVEEDWGEEGVDWEWVSEPLPWYERAIEKLREYGQPLLPEYPATSEAEREQREQRSKEEFKQALRQAKIEEAQQAVGVPEQPWPLSMARPAHQFEDVVETKDPETGQSRFEAKSVFEERLESELQAGTYRLPGKGEEVVHRAEPFEPREIQPKSLEEAVEQAHWGFVGLSMIDPTMLSDFADAALYEMMDDSEMAGQVLLWSAGGLGAGALAVKLMRMKKASGMRRSLQAELEGKGMSSEAARESSGEVFDLAAARWEQKMRGDLPVSSQHGRGRGRGEVVEVERTPEGGIRETPEPDIRKMVEEDPAAREEFMDFLAKEERELQARRAAKPPVLREVEPSSALDRFNEELLDLRELSNKSRLHPDLDDKLYEMDMMNDALHKWRKSPEDAWRLKEVENVYASFEESGNLERFANDVHFLERTTPNQYKWKQETRARRAAKPSAKPTVEKFPIGSEARFLSDLKRLNRKSAELLAEGSDNPELFMRKWEELQAAPGAPAAAVPQVEHLSDLKGNAPKLNEDGTITLYHRTTPEAAAEIRRTGKFASKENTGEVFLSSKRTGQAEGYGTEVVEVRVKPNKARLDDAFDGEIHVAVKADDLAGTANVLPLRAPGAPKKSSGSFKRWGKGAGPAYLKGDADLPPVTGRTWDTDDGGTFHEYIVEGESRWIDDLDLDKASMEVPSNAAGTGPHGVPGMGGGVSLMGLYRSSKLKPRPRPGIGGAPGAPAAAKLPDPSMSPGHPRSVTKVENTSLRRTIYIQKNDPRWQEGGEIASVGGMRYPADHNLAVQELTQPNLSAIPELKASGAQQVYHETSLRSLKDILMGAEAPGPRHALIWVSDDIDLALGQGGNKYLLEFDPRLVNGEMPRNLKNQGLRATNQKGREYKIHKTLHGSVRAITVPNKRGVQALKAMANRGGSEGRLGKALLNRFDFDNITETARGLRIPRKKQRLLDIDEGTPKPPRGPSGGGGSGAPRAPGAPAGVVEVATDTPAFKSWFGGSKVVDADGKPMVVYHGTEAEPFEAFDRAMSGKGPSKVGFWFADDAEFSSIYGKNVEVYLSIKNPKKLTPDEWNDIRTEHAGDSDWFSSWRDGLIDKGYDGISVEPSVDSLGRFTVRNPGLYAAFKPTQIKSKFNRGTFDPDDPRILYGAGLAPAAVLKSQLRKDED